MAYKLKKMYQKKKQKNKEDLTKTMIRFNQPVLSMFDQFFNNSLTDAGKYYPANIYDSGNSFVIEVQAAGFTKEDIKVNLEQNTLNITAEVKDEQRVQDEKYLRREFNKESLNKSFVLPKSVDTDNINADYQNGILKITLPRRQDAVVSKQIEIQ